MEELQGRQDHRKQKKGGLCWRACSEHSLQIETFAPGKMSRLRALGGKQEVMKDHILKEDKLGRVFKLPTNSVNGSQ